VLFSIGTNAHVSGKVLPFALMLLAINNVIQNLELVCVPSTPIKLCILKWACRRLARAKNAA